MKLIEELKFRGLLYALTDDQLEEQIEKEKLTFYLGADPTADSLHIGHLVTYLVAKRMTEHGHNPILLIGGATGLIGDPSGKSEERNLLTLEETMANGEALANQVRKILPDAQVVNNYDWVKKLDLITFLRDIGKHFGLNYMLSKDSVKSRLETGISFTEFTYQIVQSLDFMELYKTHNCKLQIGGQDQWGNITAGLELIRKAIGPEEKAYGLVIPLITKPDGTKFGKTAGGTIWLDPIRTSPYEFYQYWINLEDEEALLRLRQFTSLSKEEIHTIEHLMKETPHLRHAQKAVAEELTALVHSEEALKQVQNITQALFSNDISKLSLEEIEMGFKGVKSIEISEPLNIMDALIELSLASSKREARQFVSGNAVTVNQDKVTDETFMIKKENALFNTYTIIKRGKKLYGVIKHI
ncbi:MAG: tyrosine--tRNA ligase [Candidatus Izemoplasmataceae bacterium]